MLTVCLVYCLSCLFTETLGFELNRLNQPSNDAETLHHRFKRGGGGGLIPFRPLFVYRQQQKEKQAKWKLEEAQKLAQSQLQNQHNSIIDYTKFSSNPFRLDYAYRPVPVYPSYQVDPTYQQDQSIQNYPVNSYGIYRTSPYSPDSTYGPLNFKNQETYYDKYNAEYYS